jgi:hypothetical protein
VNVRQATRPIRHCVTCGKAIGQHGAAKYCSARCRPKNPWTYWQRGDGSWSRTAWDQAYARQGGLCYIPSCSRPIQASDHDHVTGLRRKLLCAPCNNALTIHMTPTLLRELAGYLEEHETERQPDLGLVV